MRSRMSSELTYENIAQFWITMALRALMVMLAISALTTLIAPNAGRNDSSCRLMVDSVRRVCKDTLGLDCRSLAFKLRSLCYVTERCVGVCIFTLLFTCIAEFRANFTLYAIAKKDVFLSACVFISFCLFERWRLNFLALLPSQ